MMLEGKDSLVGGRRMIVAVVVLVLVPALALVWLMRAAAANERSANAEDLHRSCVAQLQVIGSYFSERFEANLSSVDAIVSSVEEPSKRFHEVVNSDLVDTILLLNEGGELVYPEKFPFKESLELETREEWKEAMWYESRETKRADARDSYSRIYRSAESIEDRANALAALARVELIAGNESAAAEFCREFLGVKEFLKVLDPSGRHLASSVAMMFSEITDEVVWTRGALARYVLDYEIPMPQSYRFFLFHHCHGLGADMYSNPLYIGEKLARVLTYIADGPEEQGDLFYVEEEKLWGMNAESFSVYFGPDRIERMFRDLYTDDLIIKGGILNLISPVDTLSGEEGAIPVLLDDVFEGWALEFVPNPLSGEGSFLFGYLKYIILGIIIVASTSIAGGIVVLSTSRELKLAQLRNDMVATVTHELKTPVSSIRMFVETLQQPYDLTESEKDEYIALIGKENQRLNYVIDNFLSFSRMEREKDRFSLENCKPDVIGLAAKEAFISRFKEAEDYLECEFLVGLPRIEADQEALVHVLVNLLENAVKYSGADKRIEFRVTEERGEVCFEVKDNGIGIPKSERENIYKKFYQIDRKLNRSVEGCGLGLSIVDFIVSAHGGRIELESVVGEGSRFRVFFPQRD